MNLSKLKYYIEKSGKTYKEIAQETGLSRSGIHGSIKEQSLTCRNLELICKAVGVSPGLFFDDVDLNKPFEDAFIPRPKTVATHKDLENLQARIANLEILIHQLTKKIDL